MNVISRTIEYPSRSDKFRIIPLSDIHLGSAECDEKLQAATDRAARDTGTSE